MAIAGAFPKSRALARPQHRLAAVFDERDLPVENVDELVLVAVPVALARPAARRQGHEIHAEVAKAARVAQTLPRARRTRRLERRRIIRTFAYWYSGDVDLGHRLLRRCSTRLRWKVEGARLVVELPFTRAHLRV